MGTESKTYSAPADGRELWERDGQYVLGLVRKLLGSGNSQDAEDVAADIMEKLLYAKNDKGENSLQQYRPDVHSEHTKTNVTWRQFLSNKVNLYTRGKREKIAKNNGREPLLCDAMTGDGSTRWVELFGGQVWDDYPELDDQEFFERMRDHLAMEPEPLPGGVSLLSIFDQILIRIKNGEPAPKNLGLPKAVQAEAMERIRSAVRQAVTAPPVGFFDICGTRFSAAELREALTLLKAGKGNHVHRPLTRHRLQTACPKGWYHAFADAETAECEDCRVEARTGKVGGAGAGHVKAAVIHRLERLLAGCDLAEDGEVTRMDILEAELWHIKGLERCQVDAVLEAVGKVYA